MPDGTIPLVTFVGVTEKATPWQLTADIAVIAAIGFTDTVTVNVAPTPQLTVVGVTIYVAVCCVFVGLFNNPKMLDWPLAELMFVMPPVTVGALQL